MDYSPGIQFQTGLINMDEAKSVTMNNQPGKSTYKKNRAGVAPQSTNVSPQRNSHQGYLTKTQKNDFEMGPSQQEAKKASEYVLAETEKKCFMPEESLMNDEYDEESRY